jgi:hypothetical protein
MLGCPAFSWVILFYQFCYSDLENISSCTISLGVHILHFVHLFDVYFIPILYLKTSKAQGGENGDIIE